MTSRTLSPLSPPGGILLLLVAAALTALWVVGCADLRDDLPTTTPAGSVRVHPQGWSDTASANFHGNAIRSAGWDMRDCRTCHGGQYAGGTVGVSCRTCHTGTAGPENCTTCHGGANAAPPRDLSKNTATTARGVGAHQKHLLGGSVSGGMFCSQCHIVPIGVYVPGHIEDLPVNNHTPPGPDNRAELTFNPALAALPTGGGSITPAYSLDSLTCGNTYCHGNWTLTKANSPNDFAYTGTVMTGANATVHWTGGSAEARCGTCHGLPPAGHIEAGDPSSCGGCHEGIVDDAGKILDKAKHMNGKVNVFGTERDFE